ncbi:hypothetical protein Ahy_A07g037130 isoform A [Arachis hypogaea]|uniref:Uncharacterized protein n=1 Tax=Arachis hypogaea TaxID=3818 RepID=A0A445CHY1_ARAHY|nr:hypothetical protein Ahy_A07g037130 isoform A [Arachis hypogaea]
MLHSSYLFVQLILRLIGWGEYFPVGSRCRHWVLSGIALLSFRLAKAPRDKEHPYDYISLSLLYLRTWKVRDFGSSRNLLYAFGNSRWHCIFACHAVDILMGLFSSGPEMVSHAVAHEHVHSHGHGTSYPCFEYDNSRPRPQLYWITKRAGEKQGSGLMKAIK